MTPTLRDLSLALLLASGFSRGPVAQCNIADFSTHYCHENMINLTSPAITTGDQCAAACCAKKHENNYLHLCWVEKWSLFYHRCAQTIYMQKRWQLEDLLDRLDRVANPCAAVYSVRRGADERSHAAIRESKRRNQRGEPCGCGRAGD